MSATEKVVNDLNVSKIMLCNPKMLTSEMCVRIGQVINGAIDLLKEQEAEWEKIWEAPDGTYKGRCKRCGFVHIFIENHDSQYNFCPSCGRSVELE